MQFRCYERGADADAARTGTEPDVPQQVARLEAALSYLSEDG